MELIRFYELNIVAFVILMIIRRNETGLIEKQSTQHRIFMALVNTNLLLIVVDILGWVFNGRMGWINFCLNQGSNMLLYMLEILPAVLWVLYADYQVFHDNARIRKLILPLGGIVLINALASIISLRTGWFFSVDANNIYHRGVYFGVHLLFCYSPVGYAFMLILFNRKRINKKYFWPLLLYMVPLLIGSVLQIIFYGLLLNWICLTISLLIVYLNIQDRGLNTDYLTKAYNRRQLDYYINNKIRNSTKEKTFAAIIIDVNDFKQINDIHGHLVGDEALQEIVKLLRECMRNDDFIARYGGDEFCVILDMQEEDKLRAIVDRIKKDVETFNRNKGKQYQLSLSIGYDIYDAESKMSSDDFLENVDKLMYRQKKNRDFI